MDGIFYLRCIYYFTSQGYFLPPQVPGTISGNHIIDVECLSTALQSAHVCLNSHLILSEIASSRLVLTCSTCSEGTTFSTSKRRTFRGVSLQ